MRKTSTVRTVTDIRLSGIDIVKLITNKFGIDASIVTNASVVFQVPRGGDYSGMNFDITDDDAILASYETKEIASSTCDN